MATNRNADGPGRQNSPGFGLVKFLFIASLTVLFFLLALSMRRHHFFDGGQLNRHVATRP